MKIIITTFISVSFSIISFSQKDNQTYLTTGVGLNEVLGKLNKAFRSTVAFNSGIEKPFGKNWYGQVDLNFNSLRYDQQALDESSPYLFRNANSSLFLIGVNGGRDFKFGNSPWFSSLYVGTGYLNIGKPRVNLDEINNTVTQTVVRKNGIVAKGGGRIAFQTKSALFQTLYLDASLLTSTVKTEGYYFKTFGIFVGTRMSMGNDGKVVKNQMKAIRRLR